MLQRGLLQVEPPGPFDVESESKDPTNASIEYAAVVLREFRTTASFHPALGLSLPMCI